MEPIAIHHDKRLLLGLTGSIAAYTAADLASKLTQAGALVDVILTHAATQFITPLTFQSVTGRAAHTDLWGGDAHVIHIGLAERAELLVIAPVSADTLAKLAHGLADNLLTVTALAARCPIILAPAMDGGMWQNPATQANVKTLQERGMMFVGPMEGRMASGLTGLGRMAEPEQIFGQIRFTLSRKGPLAGRTVVVSAGGTREALDPVRYISNHSSGKQGYAVAQAALDRGATVTLVTGPTALPTPFGATRVNVTSAADMAEIVLREAANADALIMAAAVADFRPAHAAEHKIKKTAVPTVELEKTIDILSAVAERREQTRRPAVVVGFAAESPTLVENARDKVFRQQLSLIVANDISAQDAGFSVDTNRVTLIGGTGGVEHLPLLTKTQVAQTVMERVEQMLTRKTW